MQANRFKSILATFIPCYLFWMLLTMSVAPKELIYGVVVCGITAWFSSGFFIKDDRHAFKLMNPKRLGSLIVFFLVIFPQELIKANCAMAKAVLTGSALKQCIIKVPVHGITDYYGLAVLADCITLTPGTITFDVIDEDGKISMYVQWLIMETDDPEKASEIIKGRMEKWIRRIWA